MAHCITPPTQGGGGRLTREKVKSAMRKSLALAGDALEVAGVFGAFEAGSQSYELVGVDEAAAKGDLLHAGDLQSLAALHDAHELGGLEEGFVGPGVEPGKAPAEALHGEAPALQIGAVHIGDL